MKIEPLPDHFWTDTRIDAIQRKKTNEVSSDYRRMVKSRNDPHRFYTLTLYPAESYVRTHIGWWNQDAGARFIEGLFSLLIHHVSSHCCSNYRRNVHKDRQIISLGFVEHYSRDKQNVVSPHIHATLAVHHQWEENFEKCFHRNPCCDHYSIRPNLLTGSASQRWDQQIKSSRTNSLPTDKDKYRWIGYSSKQFDSETEVGSSFLYQGTTRKSSTPVSIRQGMTA